MKLICAFKLASYEIMIMHVVGGFSMHAISLPTCTHQPTRDL
jgi:hypothetical protein